MAHDAFDAKTGELASIRDDPEAVKARASDGALVLVTRVAGYVRSWAIPLAEAEEIDLNRLIDGVPTWQIVKMSGGEEGQ